jgi:hypothetical protein
LLIQLIKTSAFCGGRHIGLIPERGASPLLASGMLVRIGLIEIPVRHWMFALRERDIDLLAAYVARSQATWPTEALAWRQLNRCNPKILPKTENSGGNPHDDVSSAFLLATRERQL